MDVATCVFFAFVASSTWLQGNDKPNKWIPVKLKDEMIHRRLAMTLILLTSTSVVAQQPQNINLRYDKPDDQADGIRTGTLREHGVAERIMASMTDSIVSGNLCWFCATPFWCMKNISPERIRYEVQISLMWLIITGRASTTSEV